MQHSNKELEQILQRLDDKEHEKKAAIDEDVDAILASLGMSNEKPKAKEAPAKVAAETAPKKEVPALPITKVQTHLHKEELTQKEENYAQTENALKGEGTDFIKIYGAKNKQKSEENEKPRAKIINSAPLTTPLIQSETETLELPTIKAYSEMQAKRLAEIERVAVEKAMQRAQSKGKDQYNLPGMKMRTDALRVDVDDHFRDFFSNSVANVEQGYEVAVPEKKPEPEKKKGGKKKKGAKAASSANISVVASSQGGAKNGVSNVIEEADPVGSHGTLAGFSVLSQSTGAFGVPLGTNGANAQVPNTQQPTTQQPTTQQNDQAVNENGEYYTDSIVVEKDFSDTYMQNKIDFDEKSEHEGLNAGAANNAANAVNHSQGQNINANVSPPANMGAHAPISAPAANVKSDISQMIENLNAGKNDFWGENKQTTAGGAVYKEITVNMPITRTSTIGIDPDTYGVPADDYDEHHDYNHITDAPTVTSELKNIRLSRFIGMVVSAVVFAFLFALNITAGNIEIELLSSLFSPSTYLITNLALVLMLGAVCVQTLKAGFLGILGRPSTDTLVMFAFVGALAQNIIYLAMPGSFSFESGAIFAPLVALLFFTSNLGKYIHVKYVIKNFKIASTGDEHFAAFIVNGRDLTKMVCSGLSEPSPVLLVSRPTSLVKGFMKQSFSSHRSDVFARKISLIVIMAAITCTIITAVFSRNIADAATTFAAVLCIGAPITATLAYAVPFAILQRNAAKAGAVIPGAGAIQSLGYCNTVLLRSEDLFMAQNVKLHGIKPFAGRRIDTAILFAASIVYYNCNTLRDTFMALIDNKKSVLLPVKNSEVVAGMGFVANVDGQHVVFGNRAMMRRHNIEIPSLEYENNFTKNGKYSVIYLALNHRPYSIYILGYKPNARAKKSLDSLLQAGFSIVIQSDDFNITSQKAMGIYGLPGGSVKVLSQSEQDMLAGQTDYMAESEGYMTHSGNCHSFITGLRAAAETQRKEKLANTVQIATVIVTIIILLVLCLLGVLSSLSIAVILMYQILWGAIAIIPCFLNNS